MDRYLRSQHFTKLKPGTSGVTGTRRKLFYKNHRRWNTYTGFKIQAFKL